jgi:hypothetical protein
MKRDSLFPMRPRHAAALLLLGASLTATACASYGGRSTPRSPVYPSPAPAPAASPAAGAVPAAAILPGAQPVPAPQPPAPPKPQAG